jgi:pheromone shutdown-related protein TraB
MIKTVLLDNKEIIVVGTAHVSKKSVEEVKEIILKEEPDVVGVELDRNRLMGLLNKKPREIKLKDVLKTKDVFYNLIVYFLSKYQKKIGTKLNTSPGEEMLAAINSAKEVNAKILLLDRDIQITLKKLFKNIGFFSVVKMFFKRSFKSKNININKLLEDIEKGTINEETISEIMSFLSKNFKTVKRILIDERDEYMVYNIRKIDFNKMVVVVGAGHVEGIIKNINNNNIDIRELLTIKKL